MPLLEAVERASLRARVPVDARVESGTHADPRPQTAMGGRALRPHRRSRARQHKHPGFTPNDLLWILTHAPSETLILRPDPGPESNMNGAGGPGDAKSKETFPRAATNS